MSISDELNKSSRSVVPHKIYFSDTSYVDGKLFEEIVNDFAVEWERRHAGTDGGEEWIADHERVVRVLDGDFTGALVVEGLAEAFVRAVRRAE